MGLRDAMRRLIGGKGAAPPAPPADPALAAARACVAEFARLAIPTPGVGGTRAWRTETDVLAGVQRLGPFPPPAWGFVR